MLKKIIFAFTLIIFSFSAKADTQSLISSVYGTVANKHITPVNIEELAISGLKSISDIDKNLIFSNGKDVVYIYYHRKIAGVWHKPQHNDDYKAWADLTAKIIHKATLISARAKHYKIMLTENILAHAIASLNDHSKYHFSDEVEDFFDGREIAAYPDGRYLYIQVLSFDADTKDYIKNSILRYPQTQAVILDLRGNKGGQLNVAIDVAKLFIDDGIIVSTKGQTKEATKYYVAKQENAFTLPLAVLIDQGTASSAEALAAALHEQAQAILIGTQTYGKGTIQDIFAFDNGGRLALTTGEFFTPSGEKVEKIGIWPDYCIINDRLNDGPCTQQQRAGNPSDIEFAKQVLYEQL